MINLKRKRLILMIDKIDPIETKNIEEIIETT